MVSVLVDCVWSDWVVGACSKDCGSGTRVNLRSIMVNSSFGGQNCSGVTNFTEVCNVQECPGTTFKFMKRFSNK